MGAQEPNLGSLENRSLRWCFLCAEHQKATEPGGWSSNGVSGRGNGIGKDPVKRLVHSVVLWSLACEAGQAREKGCMRVRRARMQENWAGLGPGLT